MEIIQKYITNNPCYKNHTVRNKTGYMQHSTAAPGAMASTFINNWNKASSNVAVEFVIDDTGIYQLLPIGIRSWHGGGTSNNTHVGCEVCEPQETRLLPINWYPLSRNGKYNTTWAVKRLQQELVAWGYDPNGIDGSFGPGCESAVKAFQKDNGLSVDGSVGPATLAKFQTRANSYLKYSVSNNKEYFENVYNKAVYLCAYVIKQLGSSVTNRNVVSHAEGYKLGIATNHADVGHWWPEHGKSMDDFRQDVTNYMNTGKLPFGNENTSQDNVSDSTTVSSDVSDWAIESWNKAVDKGILDGTSPKGNVTREMLAVVLDRLGLLD